MAPILRGLGGRAPRDAALIPLWIMPAGGRAQRWFQRPAHIDPRNAVRACAELGAVGRFRPLGDAGPRHRVPAGLCETGDVWRWAGLPSGALRALAIGESRVM
ncbi:MAG TPA: hypothetical protein VIR33_11010 [Thermopolyspora sp.]